MRLEMIVMVDLTLLNAYQRNGRSGRLGDHQAAATTTIAPIRRPSGKCVSSIPRDGLVKLLIATLFCVSLAISRAAAETVVDITVDGQFFLSSDGNVWAYRQPANHDRLYKLPGLRNIKKIEPYIALDNSGHVFTWEIDFEKSHWIGMGEEFVPVFTTAIMVDHLDHAVSISSFGPPFESAHFLAVGEDGSVFEWGRVPGPDGQANNRSVAVSYRGNDVVMAAASGATTLVLEKSGTLLGWGSNLRGTLGRDERSAIDPANPAILATSSSIVSVVTTDYSSAGITAEGQLLYWGGCIETDSAKHASPVNATDSGLNRVRSVVAFNFGHLFGPSYSDRDPALYLKTDGSVSIAALPIVQGENGRNCGYRFPDGALEREIRGLSSPAIKLGSLQIGTYQDDVYIYALTVDHSLFGIDVNINDFIKNNYNTGHNPNMPPMFKRLKIELPSSK
jgi:hypothetical protein